MVIILKNSFLDRTKDHCFVLHPKPGVRSSRNDWMFNAENILPEDLWDQEVLGNLLHPHHLFINTTTLWGRSSPSTKN